METHLIHSAHDLEHLGMERCAYSRETFYGPLHDRTRKSGAYIDPLSRRMKVVRIMVGEHKRLFDPSFTQYVSTDSVVWNLPDWQRRHDGDDIRVSEGDPVEIYVSVGSDLRTTETFYAGAFKVQEVRRGRPTKVLFTRRVGKEHAGTRAP